VLAAVAGAAGYVALIDPDQTGHYPTCPFLAITGYYCPGCGGLRMIHALTHGQVGRAFGLNPLAFVTLPVLAYLWVLWAVATKRGRPLQAKFLRPWVIIIFTVVTIAFWVFRNLPAGHALAP
jgi:glucan phosphoethanolaminetransferase (alkaline phosphatase superfamily)